MVVITKSGVLNSTVCFCCFSLQSVSFSSKLVAICGGLGAARQELQCMPRSAILLVWVSWTFEKVCSPGLEQSPLVWGLWSFEWIYCVVEAGCSSRRSLEEALARWANWVGQGLKKNHMGDVNNVSQVHREHRFGNCLLQAGYWILFPSILLKTFVPIFIRNISL